ncbi:hypothetical protein RRG08_009840 [Elysia crispata]|uniref:C2H2-type domain-containing protein n=1 Tax=Elysia crispata TaxID=231223 RepID=A0AAE1D9Q0_9GAST|nr:hypothetical protein RRG08_009840 [Elysia crispata]
MPKNVHTEEQGPLSAQLQNERWSAAAAVSFPSQDPVLANMANLTTGLADYVLCPVCNASVCRSALKHHTTHYHGQHLDMPFRCSLCNKGFLSQSGLNHHTLTHEGRKFSCSICDSRFNQKAHLKNHLSRVHKVAECKQCGQIIKLGQEYNQHVLHCF